MSWGLVTGNEAKYGGSGQKFQCRCCQHNGRWQTRRITRSGNLIREFLNEGERTASPQTYREILGKSQTLGASAFGSVKWGRQHTQVIPFLRGPRERMGLSAPGRAGLWQRHLPAPMPLRGPGSLPVAGGGQADAPVAAEEGRCPASPGRNPTKISEVTAETPWVRLASTSRPHDLRAGTTTGTSPHLSSQEDQPWPGRGASGDRRD